MFIQIAPQRAMDSSGRIVEVRDRNTVRYIDRELTALVEVDFGPLTTGFYPDTVTFYGSGGIHVDVPMETREITLSRLEEGLNCLGIRYEVL